VPFADDLYGEGVKHVVEDVMGDVVGIHAVPFEVAEVTEVGAPGATGTARITAAWVILVRVVEVGVKGVFVALGGWNGVNFKAGGVRVVAVLRREMAGVVRGVMHNVDEGRVAKGTEEGRIVGFSGACEAEAS
jgi:hypothetical protein